MSDEIEQHLEPAEAELRDAALEKIEELRLQAEQIVGEYWAFVEESNTALKRDKKIGERLKEKAISFGPRLEKMPSGKYTKYVPNWVHYPYNERRAKSQKSARLGERVKLGPNKEYNLRTLLRYATGRDDAKILDTERELMVIRERLEMFHEIIVLIDRKTRRINRIANKYQEVRQND